jgi:hypothetical protein
MTELALHTDTSAVAIRESTFDATMNDLATWCEMARGVAAVSESLARTSFVPDVFKGKPAEVAAAILAGAEVGMKPMAALRAIDVIQGKPAMGALAQRALVQAHGHEVWVVEATATRAVVEARRRGDSTAQRSVWTIERAQKMGLTGKANWKNQPQNMLVARATAEACRLVAADVLLGMPYSTEELADGDPTITALAGTADSGAARRTARRKPLAPAPEPPEPALEEPAPAPTHDSAAPEPDMDAPAAVAAVTDAQLRKMHAGFNDAGLTDRDARLRWVAALIGRDITTSSELTKAEASQVIDELETTQQDEPSFEDGEGK